MSIGEDRPQVIQSNSQCSQEEKLRLRARKCPAIGHPGEEWHSRVALGHLPFRQCWWSGVCFVLWEGVSAVPARTDIGSPLQERSLGTGWQQLTMTPPWKM